MRSPNIKYKASSEHIILKVLPNYVVACTKRLVITTLNFYLDLKVIIGF